MSALAQRAGTARPGRWDELTAAVRRTAAGPALARLIAVVAGVCAVLIAAPPGLPATALVRVLVVGVLGAVAVGVFPRSRWVGMFIVAVVAEWLLTTIGFGAAFGLVRVALLAAAIYLVHASAAFAAVLPYDCAVAWPVVARWAGRVATVLAVGVLVGVGGMALTQYLPSARSVAGPIVGSVVAAGLAGLLAWHLRRR